MGPAAAVFTETISQAMIQTHTTGEQVPAPPPSELLNPRHRVAWTAPSGVEREAFKRGMTRTHHDGSPTAGRPAFAECNHGAVRNKPLGPEPIIKAAAHHRQQVAEAAVAYDFPGMPRAFPKNIQQNFRKNAATVICLTARAADPLHNQAYATSQRPEAFGERR
jgi:hypothetical protein